MRILVVNCGSATLKFALIETGAPQPYHTVSGEVRGIGASASGAGTILRWSESYREERALEVTDHAGVATAVIDALKDEGLWPDGGPDAIAHRVVHGGDRFREPIRLTGDALHLLDEVAQFAPLHNAPALAAARSLLDQLGGAVAQVACFDTAFHRTMPDRAARYAIPWELAERHGLRRYGFHGIAHRWMAMRAAQLLDRGTDSLRLITLQLGGGCSAAAVDHGCSLDTSMGLTPLEGLMMATRSGDLDPALPGLIAQLEGISLQEVDRLPRRSAHRPQ